MTRIGQYTGMSKAPKKEQTREMSDDLVAESLYGPIAAALVKESLYDSGST